MNSEYRWIDLDAPSLETNAKFSASVKKFSQPTSIFANHQYNNEGSIGGGSSLNQYNPNRSTQIKPQVQEIKILELNMITHYYETPFDLAIEHF